MSIRVKNTTIENGFVDNPDRVYFRDYFESVPQQLITFTLTAATGTDTEFSFNQPANTFLKEAYVVCITAPTLASSSTIGISVDTSNSFTMGSGNIIIGASSNNIVASATTQGVNSVVKVFPATELNAGVSKLTYTSSNRLLYAKVSNGATASAVGLFNLVVIFGRLDNSPIMGNKYYQLSGTGTPTAIHSITTAYSGIKLSTSAADDDTAIIFSGTGDTNPISSGILTTNSNLEFETSVCFPYSTIPVLSGTTNPSLTFIAGLKLTTTLVTATDAHQAYFVYGESMTTKTTWHFVYKDGTTLYTTNLGLTVHGDTIYNLKIQINRYRKIKVFINGQQYGLSQESSTLTESTNYKESLALTTNTSLYPCIAFQTNDAVDKNVNINYIHVSRETRKTV